MLLFLITPLLSLLAVGFLSLTGFLCLEVIAALFPRYRLQCYEGSPDGMRAILIPAHNEESVIQTTLESLQLQLRQEDKLIVVADNCSDATAVIARSMGATVLERQDVILRGKGYALDFGLKTLASDPPEVVIVVDADCTVSPGTLDALQRQVLSSGRPAQAVYLMQQPVNPGAKDQISAFAFTVKNWVRPLGLTRFRLPCPLTGTGMAFPWQALASADLASSHIVEDMKLGVDLAIAGYPPLLCSEALVLGQLPNSDLATTSQRTRWEHGHLQILLSYGPHLLKAAIRQGRFDLMLMALDLAVPPLALLVMLWLGCFTASVVYTVASGIWFPSLLFLAAGTCLLGAILIAWIRFGRDSLPIQRLLAIPLYILWKVPLYLKFLVSPQKQWVRTDRDSSTDS